MTFIIPSLSVKTEWLDGRHVVFGKIVDGMDVVKKVNDFWCLENFPAKVNVSIMLQFHGEKHPSASADGSIHTLTHIYTYNKPGYFDKVCSDTQRVQSIFHNSISILTLFNNLFIS